MQTFLPYGNDFVADAICLDNQRLGKQRVECLQILNTLIGHSTGWASHPAVRMWDGYEDALVWYGLVICQEWRLRGFRDTCTEKLLSAAGGIWVSHVPNLQTWQWSPIHEGAPTLNYRPTLPYWLVDCQESFDVADSHRSQLFHKDPNIYNIWVEFRNTPLAYHWPTPVWQMVDSDHSHPMVTHYNRCEYVGTRHGVASSRSNRVWLYHNRKGYDFKVRHGVTAS